MNGSEFNWSDFFHMGGYATYVWTSYGLALLLVVVNIVSPIIERKRVIAKVKRAIKREALREKTSHE
jgi:heme exporter protein D